jgi:serine/threonine protein kinase
VAPDESFDVRNPTAPPMGSGSYDGSSRPEAAGDGLPGRSAGGRLKTPCEWGELLVLDWMASGAFADIYLAREKTLDRPVAFKLFRTQSAVGGKPLTRALANVLVEAVLMARVSDPNVVRVYGARRVGDQVGMWMELVRGSTLQEILRTHGTFAADEARAVGRRVCAALVAVHNAGLLHRDVKAGNIMREEGGRYLLMDFGVGAEVPGHGVVPGVSGTPAYMAPEVLRDGVSTIASDIYSVGVLLFHLVTGCFPGDPVPAAGKTGTPRARRLPGTSVRLEDHRPDLPPDFVAVIEKAMDPDPLRRFRTAGAMLHALGAQAHAELGEETASGAGDKRVHRKPRGRVTPLKIVISLVPVLLGVWLVAWIVRQILNEVLVH